MNTAPIGFFDSGLGGLCVRDAVTRLLPHESTIYIADSANCPYGNKPEAEIRQLARRHVETLFSRGVKLIVVACNTATAAAIDDLRTTWPDFPFVGMEPAVKPAALHSQNDVIRIMFLKFLCCLIQAGSAVKFLGNAARCNPNPFCHKCLPSHAALLQALAWLYLFGKIHDEISPAVF